MLLDMKNAAATARQIQPFDIKGGDTIRIGTEWLEVFDAAEYGRNGWWSIKVITPAGEIVRTATNELVTVR